MLFLLLMLLGCTGSGIDSSSSLITSSVKLGTRMDDTILAKLNPDDERYRLG